MSFKLTWTKAFLLAIISIELLNICVRSIAVVAGKKEVFVSFTRVDNVVVIIASVAIIVAAEIAIAEIKKAEKNVRARK